MPIIEPKLSPARAKKRQHWMTKPTGSSKTQSEFAQDSDINIIVQRFVKTGIPPEGRYNLNEMQYADVSDFGTYQENQEKLLDIKNRFMHYPSEIREAMKNDPTQLESFLSDPKNTELLEKYNIISLVKEPTPNPIVSAIEKLETSLTKPKKQEP